MYLSLSLPLQVYHSILPLFRWHIFGMADLNNIATMRATNSFANIIHSSKWRSYPSRRISMASFIANHTEGMII